MNTCTSTAYGKCIPTTDNVWKTLCCMNIKSLRREEPKLVTPKLTLDKIIKPDLVRRKNGCRDMVEKKVIHHLVASNLSVKQIRNAVGDDAVIKTYAEDQLAEALANCYEDDEVVLFPGVYEYVLLSVR